VAVSDLVGAVLTRPSVDAERAAAILREAWGIVGAVRPLPSERDRNFAVAPDGADQYVLKISNATEDPAVLAFQHEALAHLDGAGVPCQLPIPTREGDVLVLLDVVAEGPPLLVRLLTWLPGTPLATRPPSERSPALLRDLGWVMGRAARAFDGWDHPAAHREFQWEAGRGLRVIDAHAGAVTDPSRATLLAAWRVRLAALSEQLPTMRHGVIHNDANDHNVLIETDGERVTGLLDLGDAVWSVVVNELAVAAAYAALDATDPLDVIGTIRDGFEAALPLTEAERAAVVELVALRLATSVALSAHQSRLDPDDPYLTVSEAPAWELLERLAGIDPADAAARIAPGP
jgi:Ser/Thr protein kinase RdoA (MazF antagonist)